VRIGSAAATVGTSVGLHFHATSLTNEANDPNSGLSGADRASNLSRANTEQTISNVLVGVSIAFALGAVAFWNF